MFNNIFKHDGLPAGASMSFATQIQQIMFLESMAMACDLLLFAKTGAPGLSLVAFRTQRAGE